MRIVQLEIIACDAGWRNYHFLKVSTDEGIVGWSEFDEAYGPRGLSSVIQQYGQLLIGNDPRELERNYLTMSSTARPAPHGLTAEAFGAIENALLDITAKSLGVPVYSLLGGKVRDVIPIYWSHCTTWRINHPEFYQPSVSNLADVSATGLEANQRGFRALKTNLFVHDQDRPKIWMSGFNSPFEPALNIERDLIRSVCRHLEALREGAGDDVEILLDLNFNARVEGCRRLIRALESFELRWVEVDLYNPRALALIRSDSPHPIASCETLFGVRQFLPYLQEQAVDVAIVDAVWNGLWQAMKIAHVAEAHDVNVAPHNFYSYLATMMNVHFAAAVPNLRVMEHDVDRLRWDDELFTHAPDLDPRSGISVPNRAGWGIEPIEEALRAHPPKESHAYLGIS